MILLHQRLEWRGLVRRMISKRWISLTSLLMREILSIVVASIWDSKPRTEAVGVTVINFLVVLAPDDDSARRLINAIPFEEACVEYSDSDSSQLFAQELHPEVS